VAEYATRRIVLKEPLTPQSTGLDAQDIYSGHESYGTIVILRPMNINKLNIMVRVLSGFLSRVIILQLESISEL
jgi:hypothetical protein